MELYQLLVLIAPIAIVIIMHILGGIFKGKKTYTQAIIAAFGAIQTTPLAFLSPDLVGPLIAGTAIAIALASKFTDRAKEE